MDIYANPELYEMFNLYLESTNGSRHENMRESQAMEFLTNLDDDSTDWQSLEEVYGDSPGFQWWTENGRQTGIRGFDGDYPWTIELLYDLTQKIVTNAGWDIPLEIDSFEKYVMDSTQLPSELQIPLQNASKDFWIEGNIIRVNYEQPTIAVPKYNYNYYVKMIEINEPEERVFNIIYFTLQPGEGWPKKVRKTPSLNHPEGIL
jgi:hypothetical protein